MKHMQPGPAAVRPPGRHTIEEIRFATNYLMCDCGAVMKIDEYPAHRRAMGLHVEEPRNPFRSPA